MSGWEQLGWLASGTRPRDVGWGPGPLTALRQARHLRLRRPVRLCLLEFSGGTRFAPSHAFWVNQCSSAVSATVNRRVRDADVVWVFSQDPLAPPVRRRVEAALRDVRPGVPVLNPPASYDAYHRDDAFPRLATAGVTVPRTAFGPDDVGVTDVVYKAQGEQSSRKLRCAYRGPLPGYRAFAAVDTRRADGLHRRHRSWYVAGLVFAGDVVASRDWEAGLATLAGIERTFALRPGEPEQLALAARTLGLDAFAADLLRPADGGPSVLVDVNVYPTVVDGHPDGLSPGRGQWHTWDSPARAGVSTFPGTGFWAAFDETMLRVAHRQRPYGGPVLLDEPVLRGPGTPVDQPASRAPGTAVDQPASRAPGTAVDQPWLRGPGRAVDQPALAERGPAPPVA